MNDHLKSFANHSAYSAVESLLIKPNVSLCVQENEVHYNPIHDYADDYLTFVAKGSGTFRFTPQNDNVISYSTDNGTNWNEGNSVNVNSGDKVMWKGTMTPSTSPRGIGTFSATCNFDVQGNIMSLLFGDNFKGLIDLTGKDYAFYRLFWYNTKVVNTNNLSLPATTLTSSCYNSMFQGCANLTTAPELPATTLASNCYAYMFLSCKGLTTAPELPATTLASYCYGYMFQYCPGLTTAPELPATILTNHCYSYMFYGCISLTSAPELPATTLADSCYNSMFTNTNILPDTTNIDFTSQTVVVSGGLKGLFYGTKITDNDLNNILPKNNNNKYCLPVTTLATGCYDSMFRNCTSLTTAPELPATTLTSNCYREMFHGCTSLNYIKAMFTTKPSTTYTSNWVNGVSSTGTFVKNSAATWDETGSDGVPHGWTVQTASA